MTNETIVVKDTILIYESEPGKVGERYCTAAEAHQFLEDALNKGSGGAAYTSADGLEAEIAYEITPQLRKWVSERKAKLRDDIYLRDLLNKHNVPDDVDLRRSVYAVIKEIRGH